MTIRTRFAVLMLSLPFCLLAASAQHPVAVPSVPSANDPGSEGPPPAERRISLAVVVNRKSGPPVAGLNQQDFTILDNKVPRPITEFHAVAESPDSIEVTLVIDAVNTSFTTIASERQQIKKFLVANDGRLTHPTSLVIFTDTGTQVQQGFTTDGNALSASLEHATIGLRDIRRSSGIYGADERTQLSLATLNQLTSRLAARPGRKIVIWISPGWPYLSGPGIELSAKQQQQIFRNVVNLSARLRQAHITLYSASPVGAVESVLRANYYEGFLKGVTNPSGTDIADLSLQVLAVQSGGLALQGNNDVGTYLKQIYGETSAFYELSFDAATPDHQNEYHRIEVQVAQPGLTARTSQGYYAQP